MLCDFTTIYEVAGCLACNETKRAGSHCRGEITERTARSCGGKNTPHLYAHKHVGMVLERRDIEREYIASAGTLHGPESHARHLSAGMLWPSAVVA